MDLRLLILKMARNYYFFSCKIAIMSNYGPVYINFLVASSLFILIVLLPEI